MITELEEINVKNPSPAEEQVRSKLLTLKERKEWKFYFEKLPSSMQDVYYTPEYYEIYEKNLMGKACCYVFKHGNEIALYPFLLNKINNLGYELDAVYYDIIGAYGYNGVVYTSDNAGFRELFFNAFFEFCQSKNIVAEFTRFNPILQNQKFSNGYIDLIYNRPTVYIDLTKTYQQTFDNYDRCTRQNLRRAVNSGLNVKPFQCDFPYKKDFILMYRDTMKRVNAESYLIFNDSYFNNTFNKLPLIQFVVFNGNQPIASSLCLFSSDYLHMHFEASYSEFLHLRPNDLLFDEVIKFGINSGYKKLHFGGGSSVDVNDSLLRFKSNFSKSLSDFYIGKKIYKEDIYKIIQQQWREKYPYLTEKFKNRILSYRFFT